MYSPSALTASTPSTNGDRRPRRRSRCAPCRENQRGEKQHAGAQCVDLESQFDVVEPCRSFLRDNGGNQEVCPVVLNGSVPQVRIDRGHVVLHQLRRQCRVPDEIGGEIGSIESISLRVLRAEILVRKDEDGGNDRQQKNERRVHRAGPTRASGTSGLPARVRDVHVMPVMTAHASAKAAQRRPAEREDAPESEAGQAHNRAARRRSIPPDDDARTARGPGAIRGPSRECRARCTPAPTGLR